SRGAGVAGVTELSHRPQYAVCRATAVARLPLRRRWTSVSAGVLLAERRLDQVPHLAGGAAAGQVRGCAPIGHADWLEAGQTRVNDTLLVVGAPLGRAVLVAQPQVEARDPLREPAQLFFDMRLDLFAQFGAEFGAIIGMDQNLHEC